MDSATLATRDPRTDLERVATWTGLADDALRRRTVAAANSRDVEELWGLVEAYQTAERGGLASSHTRRAYRTGLRVLLEAWQGVNLLRPPARAAENYRLALGKGLGPASVNLRLAAARALYRALRWARATEADPFRNLAQVHDPVSLADKCRPFSFHDPAAAESASSPSASSTSSASSSRIEELMLIGSLDAARSRGSAILMPSRRLVSRASRISRRRSEFGFFGSAVMATTTGMHKVRVHNRPIAVVSVSRSSSKVSSRTRISLCVA